MLIHKTISVVDQAATGQKLRSRRESKNISQLSLSKEMGITQAFLSLLELGERNWTPELISAWESAMKEAA